jgi:SHS family lactate transporter-like MFS transporter
LPALRFWAFATTPLLLGPGAFLMQVCVQGAWGVVPIYLNELSPASIRGTFPGLVYQLGNFLAAANANIQVFLAERPGGDYSMAMALVIGAVAVTIAVLVSLGREPKGTRMGEQLPADVGLIMTLEGDCSESKAAGRQLPRRIVIGSDQLWKAAHPHPGFGT